MSNDIEKNQSWRGKLSRQLGGRMAPLIFSLLTVGCAGEPGPPQFPVSGSVTIDGKPLEVGSILFLSSAAGPAAAATIEAGSFALDRATGPGQGPYKVEIISIQPTGKQVASPDDPTVTIEETRNIIPTRYNADSHLLVQVNAEGENAYRFVISSQEPKPRSKSRRRR